MNRRSFIQLLLAIPVGFAGSVLVRNIAPVEDTEAKSYTIGERDPVGLFSRTHEMNFTISSSNPEEFAKLVESRKECIRNLINKS